MFTTPFPCRENNLFGLMNRWKISSRDLLYKIQSARGFRHYPYFRQAIAEATITDKSPTFPLNSFQHGSPAAAQPGLLLWLLSYGPPA